VASGGTRTDLSALGLHTDAYELTMLDAAIDSGVADLPAVFEVFARALPPRYGYGVFAGTGRLADALARFRFDDAQLEYLVTTGMLRAATIDRLASYRFTGCVDAYREGEVFFPFSPVLNVEASFGDAVVLETLLLSILNHDSAVASGASRMVDAAAGRPLIEGGGRRTHEEAAVAAARAAYLAGFASTSNLEAAARYGLPTAGTAAHAFVLAYASEREAFTAQVAAQGPGTTLLVDTFDIAQGIRTAVEVAGPALGAVRIDSGDPLVEVPRARRLLDELGARSADIVVSGDLDEHAIERLRPVPADAFMVGTRVVLAPTPGFVYKLVAMSGRAGHEARLRPVAKRSPGKATTACPKRAFRVLGSDGHALAEHLVLDDRDVTGRPLQTRLMDDGEPVGVASLADARAHAIAARAELPPLARCADATGPALVATVV